MPPSGVHPGVAYLVECRTSSLDASLRAPRLVMQVLDSLKRSQVLREPDVVLDPDTRSLTMTARIETAQTPQLAAVMASNELLWRTNQYCGDDPARAREDHAPRVAARGLLGARATRARMRSVLLADLVSHLRRRRRDALAPRQGRRARRLPAPRRAGRDRDRRQLPLGRAAPAPHRASAGPRCATCPRPPAAPSLEVGEVDRAFATIEAASGAGSAAVRREALAALFARATAEEQRFLAHARRRRAAAGRAGRDRHRRGRRRRRRRGGRRAPRGHAGRRPAGRRRRPRSARARPASARFHLEVGRPVQPMLAKTAPSLEAALAQAGDAAVEWKLDGVRIQVHRDGDDVARVHAHARSRGRADARDRRGRARAAAALGDPRRRGDRAAPRRTAAAVPGDREPRGQPRRRRGAARGGAAHAVLLRRPAPRRPRPPRPARRASGWPRSSRSCRRARGCRASSRPTPSEAQAFSDDALARGHEGVVVKALAAPYEAGRRGAGWLKVKPVHTLDLVVLAAEWGHGRRQGLLSNLHLGARDPDDDGFVMLGKTFKGLTDELLQWQTARLLELEAQPRPPRPSTSTPSWSSRSRSTASRRARATPAAWRCASRGSSATAPTSAPTRPTRSRPCACCTRPRAA